MAIVVESEKSAPLRQGDVLAFSGDLCATGTTGPIIFSKRRADYLLVISRNCKAIRSAFVLMCPIYRSQQLFVAGLGPTFKHTKAQLEAIRDGARSPDRFYVGQLDSTGMRFVAHLDEIYMIEVPESDDARNAYIHTNRVGTLHRDFLQDLHARIFNCFARQGFDDDSWFTDKDLDLLIHQARAEAAQAQGTLAMAEADLNAADGDSQTQAKKKKGLQEAVTRARQTVEESSAELAKLEAERARRTQLHGHGSSPQ